MDKQKMPMQILWKQIKEKCKKMGTYRQVFEEIDYILLNYSIEADYLNSLHTMLCVKLGTALDQFADHDLLKLCSTYSYALKSGYLSYHKSFLYGYDVLEYLPLLGASIFLGKGNCHNICMGLFDLALVKNRKIRFLNGRLTGTLDSSLVKTFYKNANEEKRDTYVSTIEKMNLKPTQNNHVILLIDYQKMLLGLDPTNDALFTFLDTSCMTAIHDKNLKFIVNPKEVSYFACKSDSQANLVSIYQQQEERCLSNPYFFEHLFYQNEVYYKKFFEAMNDFVPRLDEYRRELSRHF